jgi:hypothetical protein
MAKIFVTEYDDGRKCVAIGDTEESALIVTEDIGEGSFYAVDEDMLPPDVSVLDPGAEFRLVNGELYDLDEEDMPLRNVLQLEHFVVDLEHTDENGTTFYAKGVLVKCPLETGVYEVASDGSVREIE